MHSSASETWKYAGKGASTATNGSRFPPLLPVSGHGSAGSGKTDFNRIRGLYQGTPSQAGRELQILGRIGIERSSGAKSSIDSAYFVRVLKPPPPSPSSFSAGCEVVPRDKTAEAKKLRAPFLSALCTRKSAWETRLGLAVFWLTTTPVRPRPLRLAHARCASTPRDRARAGCNPHRSQR